MKPALKRVIILTILHFSNCKGKMEGYIVNGSPGDIKKFPHSAHLSVNCDRHWICGASILNQKLLLTAAHCIDDCKISQSSNHAIIASVGSTDISIGSVKRKVVDTLMHQKYSEVTVQNDIAMVVVKNNFHFGSSVKRVIIRNTFPKTVTGGTVAGWGIVDEITLEKSNKLHQIYQKVSPNSECSKKIRLYEGMFCAGSTSLVEGHPSRGDSGCAFVNDKFQQLGLVSFHISRYPALLVYTNVTYYYSWIMSNAKSLFCHGVAKQ